MITRLGVAVFGLAVFASGAKSQDVVEWSSVSAAGNGCPSGSAAISVSEDGSEITWTAKQFGFDLKGVSSASRFCRVSAAAKVKPGYYLELLRQEVRYGGEKSTEGSQFSIGAQGRFFGYNLSPVSKQYSDGTAFDKPRVVLRSNQMFTGFAPATFFCGGDNSSGIFQGTVSAVGRVSDDSGFVSLGIDGKTVSYKAIFQWVPCPESAPAQ